MDIVSIIIPVYNSEKYLKQCIDSVIKQDYHDIELICVDDGSNDSSARIIYDYCQFDNRINYIKKPHTNAGDSRNLGLSIAKGKYIIFLDSDDILEAGIIKSCYAVAERDKSDIVVFKYCLYDDSHKRTLTKTYGIHTKKRKCFRIEDVAHNKFSFTNVAVWNKFYRMSFLQETGTRFKSYKCLNDMYFSIISLSSASRISLCHQVGVNYRINVEGSLSTDVVYLSQRFLPVLQDINEHLLNTDKWEIVKTDLATFEHLQLEEFVKRFKKIDETRSEQFNKTIEPFMNKYFK